MKKFIVEVKEELVRTVEIEANTSEEAESIVKTRYENEEIVLDESDFNGVEFYTEEKVGN